MTFPLPREIIHEAFVAACLAELEALKPGNVHKYSAGHGMEIRHFEDAAMESAPWIADNTLAVGARIVGAVEASFAATGLNTNLGIVLLCAPLSAAADRADGPDTLRGRLGEVLDDLDRADAEGVYRAIALANPAGLGQVTEQDVAAPPQVTLRQAMALAAGRDRIARAYGTGFEDIFEHGLPVLEAARTKGMPETFATTKLHMSYLAAFPDSHILRKHGAAAAQAVQAEARNLEVFWRKDDLNQALPHLAAFDRSLKEKGLNPGTTADFVVGTLFAASLIAHTATKRLA
jgi:triphosphoribosyl-dephospho-CoA synthase